MFADNERISWIQMERQFALAYLGPVVLWTGTGLSGRTGLCSILLGTIFLCVGCFFCCGRFMCTVIQRNTGDAV